MRISRIYHYPNLSFASHLIQDRVCKLLHHSNLLDFLLSHSCAFSQQIHYNGAMISELRMAAMRCRTVMWCLYQHTFFLAQPSQGGHMLVPVCTNLKRSSKWIQLCWRCLCPIICESDTLCPLKHDEIYMICCKENVMTTASLVQKRLL